VASRPSGSKKPKQSAWEIYRLKGSPTAGFGRHKGSPTAFVGVVYAEDERARSRRQSRNTTSGRLISGGYSRDHTNDNPPLPAALGRN
jgi:hypothetical protein